MKNNWKDIKWIFEPNGALRDIYVQDVSLKEWNEIIDLINKQYEVTFGNFGEEKHSGKIDKKHVIEYLTDNTGQIESKTASIMLGKIRLNCHFFLNDQIEFDVDPEEINKMEDFELIERFMINTSKSIDNQITLTDENDPKFPLIKIDVNRGLNWVLTEEEVRKHWKNNNSVMDKLNLFKKNLEIKLFPKSFKEKILRSANESYKSTKKNENIW